MKFFKKIIAVVLVFCLFLLTGCADTKVLKNQNGTAFPVNIYEDVTVEEGFLYSGEFVEDGSFEEKKDVFALKVKNNSDKDIQLLRIYVVTDQNEFFFEITTLPANSGVTVLEKNAQTLSEDEKIVEIRGENRVDFMKPLSLHSDIFLLTAPESVFNIQNISKGEISSDIFVYYKKMGEDGYFFGGITFRSKADGLKPDELKQIPATHFNLDDSKVIFIDYEGI